MNEPLIPSEEWVTDPDTNIDEDYDDAPCPACSALVENRAVHRAWHIGIFDLARSIPPQVYTQVTGLPTTSPGNNPY